MARKTPSTAFRSVADIIAHAAEVFRPPERLSVSDAAEKYIKLNNPGAYTGDYLNRQTPYMVEPMDTAASRDFNGEVFVSSAQTGKTQSLVLNLAAYRIKVDPMDMIIYCPTQAAARDFSARRIDRMHRYSTDIGDMLLKRRDADNKFDKHYTTGMILTLSWPSVTEFAGRPIGCVVLTDRDRMDDDIEGDGEPFDLAMKRTTTYGSFAMTIAESSPSRPVVNPKWIRTSPHEAPPTKGILDLYNRGDRRRWYWPCPEESGGCGNYFEGNFRLLQWDTMDTVLDSADTARMICPHCSHKIRPDDRFEMNLKGRWLKDGQRITKDGVIHGEGPRTRIASFWLNGVCAAFITWPQLVAIYIEAERSFERTGSEEALQKFYNNDLGEPYTPKAMELERIPEALMARAESWSESDEKTVPPEVRFIVSTVDVQKNAFVVQVHGIAPGEPHDTYLINRFQIRKSNRIDHEGDREWVKPHVFQEDWDLVTEHVLERSYPLADGSGRRMMTKLTLCDSGGRHGATEKAYGYVRKLKKDGKAHRFHLVKGDHRAGAPWTVITYPDSSQKGFKAIARGDVPVMFLNSNAIKDALNNRLDSLVPGKGMIHFPTWLPDWFYSELCSEHRGEKGWENPAHSRNEAWDLLYYAIAGCHSQLIRVEHIDWENPPTWAAEWDKNPLVIPAEQDEAFANRPSAAYDFARFGEALA